MRESSKMAVRSRTLVKLMLSSYLVFVGLQTYLHLLIPNVHVDDILGRTLLGPFPSHQPMAVTKRVIPARFHFPPTKLRDSKSAKTSIVVNPAKSEVSTPNVNTTLKNRPLNPITIKKVARYRMVPLPDPETAYNSTRDNRILYFLHIHKSGGTAMCRAARSNNMTAATTNCNPQQDQRCCGGGDSLEAQERFARTTNFTFVANEREMYRAMDPVHYRYAIMLRSSQDRYKSHWKHVCREQINHNKTMPAFFDWWTRQPDNWNVRMICGTQCRQIPKFQITPGLFNYTIGRLRHFDHILFVDKNQFTEAYSKFAEQVGWTKMPVPIPPTNKPPDYPSASTAWDPLMSALDDALYDYARQLYEGTDNPVLISSHQKNLKRYFSLGPGRSCRSPCCDTTCSSY